VADIREAYRTGRGSLKVRARWIIEDLARGQWQLVVTELPPLASTQKVLEEIEEITNPKVKAGKKALLQEQVQLKQSLLAVLDAVRDESSKDAPVRLVFEPKSRTVEQAELITALLAHTSLESSVPLNLTMVGIDGRPVLKGLRRILVEWVEFRQATVARRTRHRLAKVLDRIHVLEGRQLVLLNIDEVIRIIRNADEPKAALIARFALSDRQAEDILDIRLRQLARLEAIKIEQELKELRTEQGKLEDILASPAALKRTVIKEIEDRCQEPRRRAAHPDPGREEGGTAEVKVLDEPVTVVDQPQGLGACAQGPRAGPGHLDLQVRRCVVRLLCLPQRGQLAGLWQQRPRVQRRGFFVAGRPWRRRAHHHADRPGKRHADCALLCRCGRDGAAAGQHRRLRPAGARGLTCWAATAAARPS
jgi:topoisomerase-4 subunit A